MEVQFKQWKSRLVFAKYANNRTALVLTNAESVEEYGYTAAPGTQLIAVATVNIPEEKLVKNEVIIKDYSENEGMIQVLMDAKVISEPLRYAKTGYVTCAVCKLLVTK